MKFSENFDDNQCELRTDLLFVSKHGLFEMVCKTSEILLFNLILHSYLL